MLLRSYGSKSRKSLISRLSILAVAIGAFGPASAVTWSAPSGRRAITREFGNSLAVAMSDNDKKMSADDLEKRGIALRVELERTYQKLATAGKLLALETDITEFVVPHVSAGMTFEDAESILRAAGFSVGRHPNDDQAENPMGVVVAVINPFVQRLLGRVEVYVGLYPESPGHYTIVKGVKASFFVSQL